MRLSSILTILDKAKHQQTALARSLELQKLSQAHLELIAFRWNAMYDSRTTLDATQRKKLKRAMVEEAEAWQITLVEELVNGGVPAAALEPRTVWANDIADWVRDEVEERPYDLVVKSIHQQPQGLFYTPTDWNLLRTCPVPVLLTTNKKRKRSGKIIAALDFSQTGPKHRHLNMQVLLAAHSMADTFGAKVHCVYALEVSDVLRDLDIINAREARQRMLDKAMPDIQRALDAFGVPVSRRHFPIGKPGQVVQTKAHQLNADMIVVGTAAHRVRQMLGLGSTAERILTRARCDVLAVHPTK